MTGVISTLLRSLARPALLYGALILGPMGAVGPASAADLLRADSVVQDSTDAGSVVEVGARIEACRDGCAGVVYVWSERMPLSRAGIDPVTSAAEDVGIELTLIETEALAAYAAGEAEPRESEASAADPRMEDLRIADQLLASGALAHAPALVVHAGGRVLGPAILGYKTSEAYASALRRRLSEEEQRDPADVGRASRPSGPLQTVTELEAVGRPGAYFRWVPGREAISYESRGDIHLLDISDGGSREAPGYVDFIPSPDGRFFVTPAPRRSGTEFYDARAVFEAVAAGDPGRVDPVSTDPAMRDQYPSVGILEQEGAGAGPAPEDAAVPERSRTIYRVLTSWFEGIRYRDYEVAGGDGEIRALGPRVEPCREKQLSIPIMSQDGLEVAARDESTGTTKIFRLSEDGRCEEVEDLGVQTGKVAWHWSGRRLAFARPPLRARIGPGFTPGRPPGGSRVRSGGRTPDADLEAADGIFLYDRDTERMTRVPNSEDASSLAFPEFIGADRLVYLVPGESGEPSVFRVVEGGW